MNAQPQKTIGSTKQAATKAFSMVEVVFAMGIMTFTLLTLLALIPIGIRSNSISAEETRATTILTALEADLRNARLAPGGSAPFLSPHFQLEMPYVLTAAGGQGVNPTLEQGKLYSVALDNTESPLLAGVTGPYQASIVYVQIPAATSRAPLQARLIVNWPAISTSSVADLTNPAKVTGHIETAIAFPLP